MKNKFLILLYIFTFTYAIKGYTTECGKYSFNNDWLLKVGDIPLMANVKVKIYNNIRNLFFILILN